MVIVLLSGEGAVQAGDLQSVLVYGGFDGESVTGDLFLIDPGGPAVTAASRAVDQSVLVVLQMLSSSAMLHPHPLC